MDKETKLKINTNQQIEFISIDLIDEPTRAMRSDINDESIDELAQSIKQNGLIQPITVRPVGGRFEVIAGHRRTVATKRVGLAKIACIIRNATDAETAVLKVHENLLRRDINPIDEACFIADTIKETKVSVTEFAGMLNRSEGYVRDRLEILTYPDYLLEAIGEKQIGLLAAHHLNKITDETVRREYVRFAANGGITTKRAIAWYQSWSAGQLPPSAENYIEPENGESIRVAANLISCMICQVDDEVGNLTLDYVHSSCRHKIQQ